MLNLFTQEELIELTKTNENEKKLGETIYTIHSDEDFFEAVKNCSAKYVVVGIPEDIGMRVNGEQGGTHNTFLPTIEALVNIQENQFLSGKDILVLGYLDYIDTVNDFVADDDEKGHYLVKQLDKDTTELIQFLISADKTPIVIGGGQNNAYGILKGLSEAKNQKVNAVNLDDKPDLNKTNTRHSTNAFSFALEEGFLENYFIFGLHQNKTPQHLFDFIQNHVNIEYNFYEEIAVYKTTSFENELQRAKQFISQQLFGIEIDIDALQNFTNSTGISPEKARRFVYYLAQHNNASYLHISESSPNQKNINSAGKFISCLITDFIKAKRWVD